MPAIAAASSALDFIGVGSSNKSKKKEAAANRQLQLDTLQNQIQWRVADAKKAGVHPALALGASLGSYSPVSTNFESPNFSQYGQDISRAIGAGQSAAERRVAAGRATLEATQNEEAHALSMENMALQNEMLRSRIGRLNSAQLGPAVPDMDAAPGSVDVIPDMVTTGDVGAPERSPGTLTDYSFAHTANGFAIVPSQDMKQRIEDTPQEWTWFLRNGMIPPRSAYEDLTRMHPPRPGYRWQYMTMTGEFQQVPITRNFWER